MTRTIHGAQGVAIAQRASEVRFGGSMEGMKADDLIKVFANVPSREMPLDSVRGAGFLDVAVAAGLCKSKGEARRLVTEGGFYINNIRITDHAGKISGELLVDGRILVMRAGKKNYCLVKVT
jgi:tyrosyl-tRNA synthetase